MALAEILARKRADVAARMAATPVAAFDTTPSDRALAWRGQTGFILECKRASPSEGVLRATLDLDAVARTYAPFASAISVLTDTPYFNGSFADLTRVRSQVSQPVLCKDFIVHPYQVHEARHHGADIVLLMLSVLNDGEYRACAAAARDLHLDVLTEVHDEEELRRALALQAGVIGVNNRNLKTLQVDVAVSARLLDPAPRPGLRISESGLSTHAQVRRLRRQGYDGFLVGSSLMKAARIDRALRELIFGRVKVCGLRRAEDAAAAWDAGATFGGLIFAPGSPRQVDLQTACGIRRDDLQWVGVFVDAPGPEVARIAHHLELAAVQLHGNEDETYRTTLRPALPAGCEIWQACRIQDALPATLPAGADRVVFDTWRPGLAGGTGVRWDWSLLASCPYRERVVLSGGLAPATAQAADDGDVWALDVNSGVEQAPGIKDAARLQAFLQALRG